MKKDMSAQDYLKKYKTQLNDLEYIENKISQRLYFLCKQYPDAPIMDNIEGKIIENCKTLKNINIINQIIMIENIEAWLHAKNNYVQTSIFDKLNN